MASGPGSDSYKADPPAMHRSGWPLGWGRSDGLPRHLVRARTMKVAAKSLQRSTRATPLALGPLNATSLRSQVYTLLKAAIADKDIYNPSQELRLDERQLITALGVSRTPIREALSLLEQEGFIRTMPRRGIYIVRKSKREIIEMIQMWAALESMAARLATLHAPDDEIAKLGICSTSS